MAWKRRSLRHHQWLTEKGRWRKRRFKQPVVFAAAVATPNRARYLELTNSLDITEFVRAFELPPGLSPHMHYRVFAFTEEKTEECDPLHAATWRQVWQPALETIADAIGPRAEDPALLAFQGFWVEPPSLDPPVDEPLIPWSDEFAAQLRSSFNGELKAVLPALVADVGPATSRLRQEFWRLLRRTFHEAFGAPLSEWVKSRGLRTVRIVKSPSLVPDVLATDGCDVAILVSEPVDRTRIKLLATLHHQCAATATFVMLDETLRDRPLLERKTLVQQCLVSGGTRLVLADPADLDPVGREYTEGKSDRSPGQDEFTGYITRATALAACGIHGPRVAVLLPQSSALAHYMESDCDPLAVCVRADFAYVTALLERLKFDFDVIEEGDLGSTAISEQKLALGNEAYELLVLPTLTTLDPQLWEKIETFVRSGGRVAALGLLPRESDLGADDDFARRTARSARIDLESIYQTFLQAVADPELFIDTFPVFREDLSGGRLCSYQPRLCRDQQDAALRVHQILRESIIADLDTQADSIIYTRRQLSETSSLFLVANTGAGHVRATLRLRGTGHVQRCDLWPAPSSTGEQTPWPVLRDIPVYSILDEELIAVPVDLAAFELVALLVSSPPRPHVETTNVFVESMEASEDRTVVRGYALRAGEAFVEVHFAQQVSAARAQASASVTSEPIRNLIENWSTAEPLPERARFRLSTLLRQFRRPDTATAGVSARRALFQLDEVAGRRIFVDFENVKDSLEVWLNGTLAARILFPPFRADLTPFATAGENLIEIRHPPMSASQTIRACVTSYPAVTLIVQR